MLTQKGINALDLLGVSGTAYRTALSTRYFIRARPPRPSKSASLINRLTGGYFRCEGYGRYEGGKQLSGRDFSHAIIWGSSLLSSLHALHQIER